MDSLDPERTAGVWGYVDIKPPERKDPRWPRMQLENRCYQSTVFRKLHLELAHRQDGLQVCPTHVPLGICPASDCGWRPTLLHIHLDTPLSCTCQPQAWLDSCCVTAEGILLQQTARVC